MANPTSKTNIPLPPTIVSSLSAVSPPLATASSNQATASSLSAMAPLAAESSSNHAAESSSSNQATASSTKSSTLPSTLSVDKPLSSSSSSSVAPPSVSTISSVKRQSVVSPPLATASSNQATASSSAAPPSVSTSSSNQTSSLPSTLSVAKPPSSTSSSSVTPPSATTSSSSNQTSSLPSTLSVAKPPPATASSSSNQVSTSSANPQQTKDEKQDTCSKSIISLLTNFYLYRHHELKSEDWLTNVFTEAFTISCLSETKLSFLLKRWEKKECFISKSFFSSSDCIPENIKKNKPMTLEEKKSEVIENMKRIVKQYKNVNNIIKENKDEIKKELIIYKTISSMIFDIACMMKSSDDQLDDSTIEKVREDVLEYFCTSVWSINIEGNVKKDVKGYVKEGKKEDIQWDPDIFRISLLLGFLEEHGGKNENQELLKELIDCTKTIIQMGDESNDRFLKTKQAEVKLDKNISKRIHVLTNYFINNIHYVMNEHGNYVSTAPPCSTFIYLYNDMRYSLMIPDEQKEYSSKTSTVQILSPSDYLVEGYYYSLVEQRLKMPENYTGSDYQSFSNSIGQYVLFLELMISYKIHCESKPKTYRDVFQRCMFVLYLKLLIQNPSMLIKPQNGGTNHLSDHFYEYFIEYFESVEKYNIDRTTGLESVIGMFLLFDFVTHESFSTLVKCIVKNERHNDTSQLSHLINESLDKVKGQNPVQRFLHCFHHETFEKLLDLNVDETTSSENVEEEFMKFYKWKLPDLNNPETKSKLRSSLEVVGAVLGYSVILGLQLGVAVGSVVLCVIS